MAKGLLRLFLALWLVWVAIGVADSYKELATYAGYDRWTVDKALERNKIKYEAECRANPGSIACIGLNSYSAGEVVRDADVQRKVRGFFNVILLAPLILLLFFTIAYALGRWVIKGFKEK